MVERLTLGDPVVEFSSIRHGSVRIVLNSFARVSLERDYYLRI